MQINNRFSLTLLFMATLFSAKAQNIGIGTNVPASSAKLDITDANRGLLIPRIALTATNVAVPVTAPAVGLLVFNTNTAGITPNNVIPGFYYWNGTNWVRLQASNTDNWNILGNAGTTPNTNFLGTTDAQDFVIKTAGSAATNERLRVKGAGASTGQVIMNNTGLLAGDVFSVYANSTTNGTTASINNTIGTFAINGYSSGSGIGIYGDLNGGLSTAGTAVWGNMYGTNTTASSTSEGVWGTNNTAPQGTGATAAIAAAVRGDASGTAGTAFTMGVLGVNSGTTGSAYGVYGQTSSPNAMGVFGVNLSTAASPAHGIQGQTAAIGSAAGVRGFNTSTTIASGQNGFGIRGTANASPTGTGFVMGVRGDCSGATGVTYGVYGQSASANGFGTTGVNTNATGTGIVAIGNNVVSSTLATGSGSSSTGSVVGAYNLATTAANGVGVVGIGNNLTGSIFVPATGCGIAGTGTQYGVMGIATTTVNTTPGTSAGTAAANASSGAYFEVQNTSIPQTWAYVGVRDNTSTLRKIIGPGTVNTIVKDLQGNRVALSCPETPENLFQDYGQGQLVNGKAHINIDPVLAKNIIVNDKHPLRVFVQLEGDCKGVYVTNKTGNSFDVIELNGGTSSIPFSYTLIANRADEQLQDGSWSKYSDERFAPAPGPLEKISIETKEGNMNTRSINEDLPATLAPVKQKENPKIRKQQN